MRFAVLICPPGDDHGGQLVYQVHYVILQGTQHFWNLAKPWNMVSYQGIRPTRLTVVINL